ncbi:MAG: indole-3-glycerol-phosphate synthase [Desulfovibrionaceae bacterium]|nr:indole-3-glycerol-phosphate synthase [Desulfovibrionaceae bacterium]
MLDSFFKAKRDEILKLKALEAQGGLLEYYKGPRTDFLASLKGAKKGPIALIAEYKRASPSKGPLCLDLEVEEVASIYAKSCQAMSVLTEETFFQGNLSYLNRAYEAMLPNPLPLLRKDFLFDPLQIKATATTYASALLLIVKMVPDVKKLASLIDLSLSLGITPVVEVLDEKDLAKARACESQIIQVNSRDLQTLKVDTKKAKALIAQNPPKANETWILASGLSCYEDLVEANQLGFTAVLIGSYLMQDGDPKAALAKLLRS